MRHWTVYLKSCNCFVCWNISSTLNKKERIFESCGKVSLWWRFCCTGYVKYLKHYHKEYSFYSSGVQVWLTWILSGFQHRFLQGCNVMKLGCLLIWRLNWEKICFQAYFSLLAFIYVQALNLLVSTRRR